MKENMNPLSRKEDIVMQELDNELLIYDLKDNKAFCLNETSALVWQMCDGNKSVQEISAELGRKLKSPANEDLVWLAIDQLKEERLIVNPEKIGSKLEGLNRREIIKRVGLATMIALPVVSSIIAPIAAQAASGCSALNVITFTNTNCATTSCTTNCQAVYGAATTATCTQTGSSIACNCCTP